MPEGDTIFRTARTLDRALAGRTVTRFVSVFPALARVDHDTPLCGHAIESVVAKGKHLLISFSNGLVLRTHMRMHGSWHIYRCGERWMRPRHDMRIVVATDPFEAVAFDVPVAELITSRELARSPVLTELGPDIMAAAFDLDEAVRRVQGCADLAIADALLDQQAVAGIGNIFKSESLYVCGVNPFAPVSELTSEQIARILSSARALMQRESRLDARVYMRAGQRCRRCGTPILRRRQGPHARSTYWCEKCQARPRTSRPDAGRSGA